MENATCVHVHLFMYTDFAVLGFPRYRVPVHKPETQGSYVGGVPRQ